MATRLIRAVAILAVVVLAGGCNVLYGWGEGVPGTPAGNSTTSPTPADIGSGRPWGTVDAGSLGSCGVTLAGRLFCEQFGGTTELVRPGGGAPAWTQVSVGGEHWCALSGPGELYCWGANGVGQLGTGATPSYAAEPQRVGTASDWRVVAAAENGTCAIRGAGDLYCWGGGKLVGNYVGDGTTDGHDVPTPIGVGASWSTVAVASGHACALRTTGELHCWGGDGFVGDGTTLEHLAPTRIGTASDWTSISVGPYHSCGIRGTGELYCWGPDRDGELGDGAPMQARRSPVRVGAEGDWTAVSAGGTDRAGGSSGDEYLAAHTCGIRAGGRLYCWGANWKGELGDGTTVSRTTPTPIGTDTDWVQVSAGGGFTRGVRTAS